MTLLEALSNMGYKPYKKREGSDLYTTFVVDFGCGYQYLQFNYNNRTVTGCVLVKQAITTQYQIAEINTGLQQVNKDLKYLESEGLTIVKC